MQCHLGKHPWEDTGPRGAGSEKGLDGVSFPVERTKKERTFKTNVHSCWNLDQIFLQTPGTTSNLGTGAWNSTKTSFMLACQERLFHSFHRYTFECCSHCAQLEG